MQKLKKGDTVKILAGRDKGKQGTITRILANRKLVVEGINLVKKHMKANPAKEKPGGIIEKEAPLDSSNVGLINKTTNKVDRVGFKILQDGRKVRCFKSNNEVIDI
jgi:large subunit ribosomal protein L24